MSEGNGDYVLRRLKENVHTRRIPVIVLTGQRGKALERRMANLGASCFFNKPVVWEELWEEIQPASSSGCANRRERRRVPRVVIAPT